MDQLKEWFEDPKYSFYLNTYQQAIVGYNNNHVYESYNKIFYASKMASQAAHLATLELISNNKNDSATNIPIKNKKTRKPKLEFELNEDLIKFYEKSLKFKKAKQEEQKRKLKGNTVEYVEGEQVKLSVNKSSSEAPLERAGLKREEELKILYGDNANKIHLLETNLQMKHDKNFDLYEPKYWPSFPLKIKFN